MCSCLASYHVISFIYVSSNKQQKNNVVHIENDFFDKILVKRIIMLHIDNEKEKFPYEIIS